MATFTDKDEPFGAAGSFRPGDNVDLERRSSVTTVQGRKMSRIAPPPRNSSIVPVTVEDDGVKDEYGKLVEMEANDAIKYRTCSWQKVTLSLVCIDATMIILTFIQDCRPTLLRVYLLGNHVFPILIFDPWSCPGSDLDGRASGIRSLYFARRLVSPVGRMPHWTAVNRM